MTRKRSRGEDSHENIFPLHAQAAPSTPLAAMHIGTPHTRDTRSPSHGQQDIQDIDRNPIIGRVIVPPMTRAQAQLIKQENVSHNPHRQVVDTRNLSQPINMLSDLNNPIISQGSLTNENEVSEAGFLRTRHQRSRSGTRSRSRSRSSRRSYHTRSRSGAVLGVVHSTSNVHQNLPGDTNWSMSMQNESHSRVFRDARSGRASIPPPCEQSSEYDRSGHHQSFPSNQHNARNFEAPNPGQPEAPDKGLPKHKHKGHRRIQSMPLPRNELLGDVNLEENRMISVLPSLSASPEYSHDETGGEALRESDVRVKSEPRDVQRSRANVWVAAQSGLSVNGLPAYELVDIGGTGGSVVSGRTVHAPRVSHRKHAPVLPRSVSHNLWIADDTQSAENKRLRSNSDRRNEKCSSDVVTLAPIRHRALNLIGMQHDIGSPTFQDMQRFVPVSHSMASHLRSFSQGNVMSSRPMMIDCQMPPFPQGGPSLQDQGDDFVAGFLSSSLDVEKPVAKVQQSQNNRGSLARETSNPTAVDGTSRLVKLSPAAGKRSDHAGEISQLIETADSFLKRSPVELPRPKSAVSTSPTPTVRESISPPKRVSLHALKRPPVTRGLRGSNVGRNTVLDNFTSWGRAMTSPTGGSASVSFVQCLRAFAFRYLIWLSLFCNLRIELGSRPR